MSNRQQIAINMVQLSTICGWIQIRSTEGKSNFPAHRLMSGCAQRGVNTSIK